MIVTESTFSMDGDQAPLRGMVELKEKYHADLMVDEAHSTGLYGEQGRGLSNSMNLSRQVDIQMGTLSKALGSSGGFICGSKTLIEFLVNRARSFIFSTAPSPVVAAMSLAAVELVQSAEGQKRRDVLWQRVAQLCDGLRSLGITVAEQPSAIIPVMIGGEKEALDYGRYLYDQGFLAPAIRYPTVARGASRIRLTVSASHKESDICALLKVLSNRRP
jgi:7-keto-8-aminopelargonate synthetase-like enzyme